MTRMMTQIRINRQALLLGAAIMAMGNVVHAQDAEATAEVSADSEGAAPEATAEAEAAPAPEAAPDPAPEPAPTPVAEPAPAPAPVAEPEEAPAVEAEESDDSVGISLGVGIASIYNFRGYNTFKRSSQNEQKGLFAPSFEWSIGNTGLALGYWGAFQMTGGNRAEMVDIGLGHEQDLYLSWGTDFADGLVGINAAFTYFFYPFADEDAAGAKNPSIIEPLLGISLSTVIDIGFSASYFHGIQDEIKGVRHAYFNLSLGKGFEFNNTFGMNIGAALGVKAWVEDNDDNVVDLVLNWSIPIALTDELSVEPGIHLAWSNFEDTPAGDEYMVYWTTDIGASF